MPDPELRQAASDGTLGQAEILREQTRRMLRDPKARRLANEFFGQWLGFYRFDRHGGIDGVRFPEFNDPLKDSMLEEAVRFFEYIIRQDRPAREIFFADYTFVNAELASHYGISDSIGQSSFQRVDGASRFHRGGLLGLGAILTKTSAPLRTSPVKRGDWILRRILGIHVPPPPPDAGSIPADDVLSDGLTVRERLKAHRRNAKCVNCHARIDPPGFALEHFDPIGRWREHYRDGKTIDDSATTREGAAIAGFSGLREYLEGHEEQIMRNFSKKLLGYALGRSLSPTDQELIEEMVDTLQTGSGRVSDAVLKVVLSKQFRYRRREESREISRATRQDK